MAFKTMTQFNEERFGDLFVLRDNNDYADVIFLYRGVEDVLIADAHYIKSNDYTGYVHCCGAGCPACAKGIRVQTKLLIPVYNITDNQIQFWDRNIRFENQLMADVFKKFANPCNFVFRITRQGVANDINTKYSIVAVGKNSDPALQYDAILSANNVTMPDHFNTVCKEVTSFQLESMINGNSNPINNGSNFTSNMPSYQVTPRINSTATENDITNTFSYVSAVSDIDNDQSQPDVDIENDVQF